MSRQIELLDKFYDNKATESEKRQLAGLLNDPDRWTDDFDKIWDHSFGHMPDSTDELDFKAITQFGLTQQDKYQKVFYAYGYLRGCFRCRRHIVILLERKPLVNQI